MNSLWNHNTGVCETVVPKPEGVTSALRSGGQPANLCLPDEELHSGRAILWNLLARSRISPECGHSK